MASYIISIGVVFASTSLILIWIELRRLANIIESGISGETSMHMWAISELPSGYAIWTWTEGRWVLSSDLSESGYHAVEPTIEGAFEGHTVKAGCRPNSNGSHSRDMP